MCGIPNPLTLMFHWVIVFQPLKDFLFSSDTHKNIVESSTHCQGYWCFQFAARGAAQNYLRWIKELAQLLVNFLLRCSKTSPLVVRQHNLKILFLIILKLCLLMKLLLPF